MLGICIVFLLADEWGEFLARSVVEQIRRTTTGPYRIYGYAPRATDAHLAVLQGLNVTFLPVPEPATKGMRIAHEHSFFLDHLVTHAFRDGCDHVATFDMDSWPVSAGWDRTYSAMLSPQVPVAAIVRTELTDNFPFAAFLMMPRGFWLEGISSFASRDEASPSRRPGETGSGILEQLAREGRDFLRLERTNRWNPHPIIGGLYDDAFFHLGAGSRSSVFLSDDQYYALNGRPQRKTFAMAVNSAIRDWVLGEMQADHDALIAELAEGTLRRFAPIRTVARGIPPQIAMTHWSARLDGQ